MGEEEFAGWTVENTVSNQPQAAEMAVGVVETRAPFEIEYEEEDPTVDGRIIDANATNFEREPPLPFMMTTETSMGHEGARLAGVIQSLKRNGKKVLGTGFLDLGSEAGAEAHRLVDEGILATWSPDMGNVQAEVEVLSEDEEGFPTKALMHLRSGTLLGGTMVPFPALSSAKIRLLDAMAASATTKEPSAALDPPLSWFEDPQFTEATALTVTDDGRVFGHAAIWGTCHVGVDSMCLVAPHSANDYAYFKTGVVKTKEGVSVATGPITLDTGHAPLTMNHRAASSHYDDTGVAVADVVVGEDRFGPWVAGALRPDVAPEQIRKLRASALSGDWRAISGGLELIALLAVNVPGYPVTRAAVASGAQISLVAAGGRALAHETDPVLRRIAALEAEMARVSMIVKPLRPAAREAIAASVRPTNGDS